MTSPTPSPTTGRSTRPAARPAGWLTAGALAAALVTTGCTHSSGPATPSPTRSTSAGASAPAKTLSPAKTLARAAARFDAARTFHFTVTSSGLPAHASGLTAAEGDAARPDRVKGQFTIQQGDSRLTLHALSIGDRVWTQLPVIGTWVKTDPRQFGAPAPSVLLSDRHGLGALFRAIHPTGGHGNQVHGTVTGSAVASWLPAVKQHPLQARLQVDRQGRPARLHLDTGAAGRSRSIGYTLTFSGYDAPVSITAP